MKTTETRQVTISDFKAHCTAFLKEVETGEVELIITRHGKVIAIAKKPDPETKPGSLLGAGIGTGYIAPGVDLNEPAFDYEDWEINQNDARL